MLKGQPFRFMTLLIIGWVGFRAATAEPTTADVLTAPGEVARLVMPEALAEAEPRVELAGGWSHGPSRVSVPITRVAPAPLTVVEFERLANDGANYDHGREALFDLANYVRPAPGALAATSGASAAPVPAAQKTPPDWTPPATGLARADRWSASSWVIARQGFGAQSLAPGGTLGGSQGGVRALFRPGLANNRLGLYARTSSPLQGLGGEAAFGAEYQPFARVPVRVALEQRFPLTRNAPKGTALSLVGGVSDVPLARSLRLNAYGQAGVLGFNRRIGFADGALTVDRQVADFGTIDVALGAGAWGAVQPGLSRFDAGPRAEFRFPVNGRRVRMGVEWRQRLLGNANPGSGAAVTVGSDF